AAEIGNPERPRSLEAAAKFERGAGTPTSPTVAEALLAVFARGAATFASERVRLAIGGVHERGSAVALEAGDELGLVARQAVARHSRLQTRSLDAGVLDRARQIFADAAEPHPKQLHSTREERCDGPAAEDLDRARIARDSDFDLQWCARLGDERIRS